MEVHAQVPEVIARGDGVLGEVVLRRRPGPVTELIVNGVFLMDTAETTTERLLAEIVLARHAAPRRVLVGGLGLGCTVTALLVDGRPERVDVVEIEPLLVRWFRAGLVPGADRILGDPRVRFAVADLGRVLLGAPMVPDDEGHPGYDAILLDVDNGPGFLVHAHNAALYQAPALAGAARALRPGGLLAVWSAAEAPALRAGLATAVGPAEEVVRRVEREGRELDYHVYVAARR